MEPIPFDWSRLFWGDQSPWLLAEICFRTAFLYLYMILLTRFVGRRRSLGKLTPFEYILVIVLGPAAGGGMVYPHVPLFHAMAVMTVIGVLARVGAVWAHRYAWAHDFFEGKPLLVVRDGCILPEALAREHITEEDVRREIRQAGLERPEQVARAYFESSGQMSIIPKHRKDE